MNYTDILKFWFEELTYEQHFKKDDAVDARIKEFSEVHAAVAAGATSDWRDTAQGALAEVIVLDQFSRNMFRGSAESFAYDERALQLAQQAIAKGQDKELDPKQDLRAD